VDGGASSRAHEFATTGKLLEPTSITLATPAPLAAACLAAMARRSRKARWRSRWSSRPCSDRWCLRRDSRSDAARHSALQRLWPR